MNRSTEHIDQKPQDSPSMESEVNLESFMQGALEEGAESTQPEAGPYTAWEGGSQIMVSMGATFGAIRYQTPEEKQAFQERYISTVSGVLAFIDWDSVAGGMSVDNIPPAYRFWIGLGVIAGGAFLITPDGFSLFGLFQTPEVEPQKRRYTEPEAPSVDRIANDVNE